MAVTTISVRIESLTLPEGRMVYDPDLGRRVEAELVRLLERETPPQALRDGALIAVPGGRVHTGSLASPASVAHALARHVHAALVSEAR